jgi:hypothetical protein
MDNGSLFYNNGPCRTLILTYPTTDTALKVNNGRKEGGSGPSADLPDAPVQQVEASLNGLSHFLKRL